MIKLLNVSSTDGMGGAGKAAYRLHESFLNFGLDSKLLVNHKHSTLSSVIPVANGKVEKFKSQLIPYLNSKFVSRYNNRKNELFSASKINVLSLDRFSDLDWADVIVLYWVAGGFLDLKSLLKVNKPIFWRLSDMWPFTGGCHYAYACEKYKTACSACETLKSTKLKDLSFYAFLRKQSVYSKLKMHVIAPSKWIAREASLSSLLRNQQIHYVPTGVDTAVFHPTEKNIARDILGLPRKVKIILYSGSAQSNDKRKGYDVLEKVMLRFKEQVYNEDFLLVNFGSAEKIQLGVPAHSLGRLNDDVTLSLAYSAADMLLFPSSSDNLPNVILEAMACGLPVVATDCGGIPELVNQNTGVAVQLSDISAWVEGIKRLLFNPYANLEFSRQCREHIVSNYDLKMVTKIWKDLFEKVLIHGR